MKEVLKKGLRYSFCPLINDGHYYIGTVKEINGNEITITQAALVWINDQGESLSRDEISILEIKFDLNIMNSVIPLN